MVRYYVYMLRCHDQSLYTGYARDLTERIMIHQEGKGSKYTRSRLPITCVFWEGFDNKSEAMKRENSIKKMTKAEKEALVNAFADTLKVQTGRNDEQSGMDA